MLNPFENFPSDMVKHIASFLDYRSLGRFNSVAKFFKKNTDPTLTDKRKELEQKILSNLIEPFYSTLPSDHIEKDINFLIASGKKFETFSALIEVYNKLQKSAIEEIKTKFEKILLKYFKIAGFFCIQTSNTSTDEGPLEDESVKEAMVTCLCLSIISNEKLDDENLHLLYDYCKKLAPETSPNSYEGYLSEVEKSAMFITDHASSEQKEKMLEKAKTFLKELNYFPESNLAPGHAKCA